MKQFVDAQGFLAFIATQELVSIEKKHDFNEAKENPRSRHLARESKGGYK